MLLYFMRHAEAEDAGPGMGDAARRLTEKGLQRSRAAGAGLAAMEVDLDLILTSPLVRAVDTAELVGAALEVPVRHAQALVTNVTLDDVLAVFEEHGLPEALMVVGHEPDFSRLVGELIGGGTVEMKKGAVACVRCQSIRPGGGTLLWLLTGRQLAKMAG